MSTGTEDPPQPPPYNHRTATSILSHAAKTTISLFPTTLFLTLLLFSFRSSLQTGTAFVTTFIDTDPSLKSLISHLSLSPTAAASTTSILSHPTPRHLRRHRPFLHLTRVGTLDDDEFFSSDDTDDRSLFGPHYSRETNSTFIPLFLIDSKPGVVRPGVLFDFSDDFDETSSNSTDFTEGIDDKGEISRVFIAGLEIGRKDLVTLFLLISALTAGYGWVILGFVITFSWALGIVFVAVVNDLLQRYSSFTRNVWNGTNLGVRRLSGFFIMRWAVRDALTQVLGLWFFGEIRDQYAFLKLFLRLKLMPFSFSIGSPWVLGYDKEISWFLITWNFCETLVSFALAVGPWVTIVNTRRGGREIVKEGFYLLPTLRFESIKLYFLELIVCGEFVRWVLVRVCGKSVASLFQSFFEVYFMVAWLIFYFAARFRDARLSGRRFGRRELEGLIEGMR